MESRREFIRRLRRLNVDIGEQIIKLRLSQNLSKKQLSQMINKSIEVINNYENNKSYVPKYILNRISVAINLKCIIDFISKFNIENETVTDVYFQYCKYHEILYSEYTYVKPLGKSAFGREIIKLGYNSNYTIRVNGTQKRIYKKLKD
ncbi:helix-turn-helix transcriptional regulator [Clostridium sporogenes]|nr:helix-turn-helix transcriptional regulator [Clostridium sporogenes]NFQ67368.1 helix-turn-helix transcriptional regulator [Clostridium sporogenes]